jgi:hypothetical protein
VVSFRSKVADRRKPGRGARTSDELRLHGWLNAPLEKIRDEIAAFYSRRIDQNNAWPVTKAWQEAAAELRTNPDAALPALAGGAGRRGRI